MSVLLANLSNESNANEITTITGTLHYFWTNSQYALLFPWKQPQSFLACFLWVFDKFLRVSLSILLQPSLITQILLWVVSCTCSAVILHVPTDVQCCEWKRPAEDFNFIIFKPLISSFGCMFEVIVLLIDPFTLWHVQVFKAFLQCILQNLTVLFCIYPALNLYKCPNSIPAHASPYHETVSSSMLDCQYSGPIRNAFTSWFPVIVIWANPIDLCFIWPQYLFPVLYCPVCMIWANLRHFCWWICLRSRHLDLTTDQKLFFLRTLLTVNAETGDKMALLM